MKKVLYLHGKEGSPNGTKIEYIRSLGKYNVHCESYDTGKKGEDWRPYISGCIEVATKALHDFQPDIVVASSFGGGVILSLLQSGICKVPTIILAGAGRLYGLPVSLPQDVKITLIHGIDDKIVPFYDSLLLANTSPTAKLVALQDGHRLYRILKDTNILEQELDIFCN